MLRKPKKRKEDESGGVIGSPCLTGMLHNLSELKKGNMHNDITFDLYMHESVRNLIVLYDFVIKTS